MVGKLDLYILFKFGCEFIIPGIIQDCWLFPIVMLNGRDSLVSLHC